MNRRTPIVLTLWKEPRKPDRISPHGRLGEWAGLAAPSQKLLEAMHANVPVAVMFFRQPPGRATGLYHGSAYVMEWREDGAVKVRGTGEPVKVGELEATEILTLAEEAE